MTMSSGPVRPSPGPGALFEVTPMSADWEYLGFSVVEVTADLTITELHEGRETAIVPLSGGGLLGGIALALKTACAGIHIVGVSMERGPAMVESLRAGRVVDIVEEPTIADALAGGIAPNVYTFDIIQRCVDETVLVSEDEIAGAMAFALKKHHLVVEGGGAVGIAALLYEKVERLGRRVAVVVSGGNVELSLLIKVAGEH